MALRSNVARLKELILRAKIIDEFQMKAAMGHLEQWGGRLPGTIVEMGFCDDERMTQFLSQTLKVPRMHLGMVNRDATLLAKVPVEFATEHGVFPVTVQGRTATVAMSDPSELDTVDLLASMIGARVQVMISSEIEVQSAIAKHYRGESVPATRVKNTRARDAHIEATNGQVFELDTRPPPPPDEQAVQSRGEWLQKSSSANSMLDEIFEDDETSPGTIDGFTPDEVKRIEAARANQRKTTAILLAVRALLGEKGYFR